MLTVALILFPMFMFLLMVGMKHARPRLLALIGSLIQLVGSLYLWYVFQPENGTQFGVDVPWWESPQGLTFLSFRLGIDGIGLPLILLTTVLVPLIILSSKELSFPKPSLFYGLVFLMQSALLGVFASFDIVLFYIFWELALIPIFLICIVWGSSHSNATFIKFFIYTLGGSLLMLAGILYVFTSSTQGKGYFDLGTFQELGRHLPADKQSWIFWAMFLAFAIKMPVFPFHTWQPDTYTYAPTQASMLLAGIMLKMGIFGVIRWLLPTVPLGVAEWGNTALLLSVIGIVYASCIALVQGHLKTLVAYSSIAHVGLISAGVFTQTQMGIQGAMIQMVSHGLIVFGLFYVIDILQRKVGNAHMKDLGGLRNVMPKFATVFLIIILASVALPLTSGFVGEFLLINSLIQHQIWIGAAAGLTIIFGAVYMLVAFQRSMSGEQYFHKADFTDEPLSDLTTKEKIVLYPLVVLIFIIGIFPAPLLAISEPSVTALLKSISDLTASVTP